jgi:peptidoglycan/LPS O-acetylase OafA/YrhL
MSFGPVVRLSRVIARYSYSIYLSHVGVTPFCFGLPVPIGPQWLIFAVLAIVTPVVLYHLIEDPLIRVARKIADRIA